MTVLDALSPEQLAAATSSAPVVLVEAAAGGGKTATLAARARWLIDQGEDPASILVLAFTRSAVAELRARIGDSGVRIETFHSFAWAELGRPQIATFHEADAALRSLYEGNLRRKDRDLPGIEELRAAIARYEAGEDVEESRLRFVLVALSRLRDAGLVPLWDLVPRFLALTPRGLDVRGHVLVDEWQDTTASEALLAMMLRPAGPFFAVGDPRQAIFGWKHGRWLELDRTERHTLSRSYRFSGAIASYANRIGDRFGADPIRGNDENDDDVRHIPREGVLQELRRDPTRTLILARTNRECALLQNELEGRAAHARRDPRDPLSSESDRFSEIWASGRAVVSTVHGAKGREAARVIYVRPGIDEGHEDAEENRIDYVAVTRARKRLAIVRGDGTP